LGEYPITVKVFAAGELVSTETVHVQIRRRPEGEEVDDAGETDQGD
jgi:hypothetical protein